MRISHWALVLSGAVACSHPPSTDRTAGAPGSTLWLLATEPAGDAVHAADTEITLRERYGAAHVITDSVHLGEGEMELGTVLYPHDPTRRLEVLWTDTIHRARPALVVVGGVPSRWTVWPGIRMRTSLAELERLNGRPFYLYGFATHGGGTVDNWAGGRLDRLWHPSTADRRRVIVRLTPSVDRDTSRFGGQDLMPSNTPGLAALRPHVYDLAVIPR